MSLKRLVLFPGMAAMLMAAMPSPANAQQGQAAPKRMYNTAKQKMLAGKPLIGGTVSSPDPNIYCAMANAGFDYTWIEMQHSPLTYSDVAKMIWACRGATAMPFIRVPDATESEIQKATDIGALGIIVPTVDTVEKAEATVRWSKYPPQGRRSQGGGQYGAGAMYRGGQYWVRPIALAGTTGSAAHAEPPIIDRPSAKVPHDRQSRRIFLSLVGSAALKGRGIPCLRRNPFCAKRDPSSAMPG